MKLTGNINQSDDDEPMTEALPSFSQEVLDLVASVVPAPEDAEEIIAHIKSWVRAELQLLHLTHEDRTQVNP